MLWIVAIMICGMAVGWLLRGRFSKAVEKAINVRIWLLLFLLGVEVGGNERIVNGIATLGLEALLLAVAGCAGSALLAWALWRWSQRRKVGRS